MDLPFEHPFLKLAVDAVLAAGEQVARFYKNGVKPQYKADGEPVTEADLASNKIILEALATTNYHILSEESEDNKSRLSEDSIWIVDPLDGTKDFINKTDEFTIMVALVKNHQPILGIIYWPFGKELFVGGKGKGAFCWNESWNRMHVSSKRLSEARAVISRHHGTPREAAILDQLKISERTTIGSSLKIMRMAQGLADLYVTTTLAMKHWDTAASNIILTEAGGRMSDFTGADLEYNVSDVYHQRGIIASNGVFHEALLPVCEKFLKPTQSL